MSELDSLERLQRTCTSGIALVPPDRVAAGVTAQGFEAFTADVALRDAALGPP